MITNIESSPLRNKRFRVFMDNGKYYDFGLKNGDTYIDNHDMVKRLNYLKRHLANETEHTLIKNLVPSPSLFSAYLLWGKYTSIEQNIHFLNSLWEKKHMSSS